MEPPPPPSPPLTLAKIKAETKRVFTSQPTHRLLGLTYLFLSPFPAATTILYQLLKPYIFLLQSSNHQHQSRTIFIAVAYSSVALLFSSFSAGSITYTAFHAFHTDQPIELKPAIKSLSASFFPLLTTTLLFHLISVIFSSVAVLFSNDIAIIAATTAALIIITVYLHVNLSLVYPVVVIESKWGFAALRRSHELVKGKRWEIAAPLFVNLLCLSYLLFWTDLLVPDFFGGARFGWRFWFDWAVNTAVLPLIQLHYMVANTVLYVYCKADHGGDDVSHDYVRLDGDDANV